MDKIIFSVSFNDDRSDITDVTIESFDSNDNELDFSLDDVATALELMYDQVSYHINNMYEEEDVLNRDFISITC